MNSAIPPPPPAPVVVPVPVPAPEVAAATPTEPQAAAKPEAKAEAKPAAATSTAAPGADLSELLGEPAARPWYLRRWLWGLLAAVLLAAAGLAWWWAGRAAKAEPGYTTVVVGRGDLTLTVTANGTVQPTRSINIGSELSGTVLKVNVDVNDSIKKGQVLVVLDTAKLRGQILRSQATLAAAHARHAQTGATVAEARAALGRLEEVARLSGGKVPSKAELDSGRAPWRAPLPMTAVRRPASAMRWQHSPPTRSTSPRPRSPRPPMAWC